MMKDQRESRAEKEMRGSIFVAFLLHAGGFLFVLIWVNTVQANLRKSPEVFTVTLEGGEALGGVSQAPVPGKEEEKPPLDIIPEEVADAPAVRKEEVKKIEEEKKAAEKKEAEKKKAEELYNKQKQLEQLTLIEELEKKKREAELLEKKKQEEEKKKKEAELKKKELEEKKKKELEDKKRKEEEAKKKAEADKKKQAQDELAKQKRDERAREQAKKDRDKRLSDLAREIRGNKEYHGESVRAGGEGYGAARLGGTGGGGGTLAPYAKVAYQNELQAHVKSGWRWMQRSSQLKTLVEARIRPDGEITSVKILQSSGNGNFDDSVVRAVKKASPVPPPPREFYNDFSVVGFWFDSKDQ